MDFILFYFFLQFVEELLKWLAGPPITSGDMPRQALPSSSWQVRYYIWWMCGNYTSTMRSSPYSAFSTLPPHPSVTLMGDKFNLTFCLSSYHIKYNENKTENKDRSKIKDKRAGRKKRQINGKTGWQWVCVSQRLISWSGITISVCVCARHRKREGPGHSIFNCCTTFSSPSAPGSDVSVWLNLPPVFGRRKKYLNTLKMIVLYTFTIGLFIENMSSCSNTFRCNVV